MFQLYEVYISTYRFLTERNMDGGVAGGSEAPFSHNCQPLPARLSFLWGTGDVRVFYLSQNQNSFFYPKSAWLKLHASDYEFWENNERRPQRSLSKPRGGRWAFNSELTLSLAMRQRSMLITTAFDFDYWKMSRRRESQSEEGSQKSSRIGAWATATRFLLLDLDPRLQVHVYRFYFHCGITQESKVLESFKHFFYLPGIPPSRKVYLVQLQLARPPWEKTGHWPSELSDQQWEVGGDHWPAFWIQDWVDLPGAKSVQQVK